MGDGGMRIVGRPRLDERPALPAGHPETWGLLTNGTVLDGAEYPFPIFMERVFGQRGV